MAPSHVPVAFSSSNGKEPEENLVHHYDEVNVRRRFGGASNMMEARKD